MSRQSIPYIAGAVAAVGGFFLMEWLQDSAPRIADFMLLALVVYSGWTFWPWRARNRRMFGLRPSPRKEGDNG